MIEEKEEKKEDLIEIRIVEKIVLRKFYKYLKVFEKKYYNLKTLELVKERNLV